MPQLLSKQDVKEKYQAGNKSAFTTSRAPNTIKWIEIRRPAGVFCGFCFVLV